MKLILLVLFIMRMQVATSTPVFREVAPLVVRTLHDYGGTMAASKATGPILLDMASFHAAARRLGETFDEERFLGATPEAAKKIGRAEALVCDNAGPGGRHQCFVAENGTYVAIESVRKTDGGLEAYATLTWTERRRSGVLSLGSQTLRLTFAQSTGGWRLTSQKITRQT